MPVCVCVLCGATINDFTPKVLHLNYDSNFVPPPPPPPATPPIDRQTDRHGERGTRVEVDRYLRGSLSSICFVLEATARKLEIY